MICLYVFYCKLVLYDRKMITFIVVLFDGIIKMKNEDLEMFLKFYFYFFYI